MIYLSLFWEFLKIGLFTFGGAYGAIPLIRECVLGKGWMDEEMIVNMLAVSESTPGPIMVNAATYVGSQQAGVAGAALATLGVVLPAFIVILLAAAFLQKWLKSRGVRAVLRGIKPCVMGIILATGISMIYTDLIGHTGFAGALIFVILAIGSFLYRRRTHKELSPIILIVTAALLGAVLL